MKRLTPKGKFFQIKKESDEMTTEERLENIERALVHMKMRNRWLMSTILLLVVGLVITGVLKTAVSPVQAQSERDPKIIRARQFILVDEKDKIRASLTNDKGGSMLTMWDEKGVARIKLAVDAKGPWLVMNDETGILRSQFSVYSGGPALAMFDKEGKCRTAIAVSPVGPALVMMDNKEVGRLKIGTYKSGPEIAMYDETGIGRLGFTVIPEGPRLALWDKKGIERVSIGRINMELPNNKINECPESTLFLFGPDGKVIWSAIK